MGWNYNVLMWNSIKLLLWLNLSFTWMVQYIQSQISFSWQALASDHLMRSSVQFLSYLSLLDPVFPY